MSVCMGLWDIVCDLCLWEMNSTEAEDIGEVGGWRLEALICEQESVPWWWAQGGRMASARREWPSHRVIPVSSGWKWGEGWGTLQRPGRPGRACLSGAWLLQPRGQRQPSAPRSAGAYGSCLTRLWYTKMRTIYCCQIVKVTVDVLHVLRSGWWGGV